MGPRDARSFSLLLCRCSYVSQHRALAITAPPWHGGTSIGRAELSSWPLDLTLTFRSLANPRDTMTPQIAPGLAVWQDFLEGHWLSFTPPSGRAAPPRQPPLPLCGRSGRIVLPYAATPCPRTWTGCSGIVFAAPFPLLRPSNFLLLSPAAAPLPTTSSRRSRSRTATSGWRRSAT